MTTLVEIMEGLVPAEKTFMFLRSLLVVLAVIVFVMDPLYMSVLATVCVFWGKRHENASMDRRLVILAAMLLFMQEAFGGHFRTYSGILYDMLHGGWTIWDYAIVPVPWRTALSAMTVLLLRHKAEFLRMNTDDYIVYREQKRESSRIKAGAYDYGYRRNVLVIGTTGSGKTTAMKHIIDHSVRNGEPVVVFSAKNGARDETEFYSEMARMCEAYGRDYYVVSMDPAADRVPYNPLKHMTPAEVADALTTMAGFSEKYYSDAYHDWIISICGVIRENNRAICLQNLLKLFKFEAFQKYLWERMEEGMYTRAQYDAIAGDKESAEISRTSISSLKNLVSGELAEMFGADDAISITDAVQEKAVILVNMDLFTYMASTRAIGQLATHDLHHVIGRSEGSTQKLVVMDEVSGYFCDEVTTIAKLGRSYGFQLVVGSQSYADLRNIGDDFADILVENSNAFVIMRQNAPEDAESSAKIIGTMRTTEVTRRVSGAQFTAEGSVKPIREYKVHPDQIKELGDRESVYYKKEKNGRGEMLPVIVTWKIYQAPRRAGTARTKDIPPQTEEDAASDGVLHLFDGV